MSWTDERIALLKKMWKEGKSAADIAKTLSRGVTRNAVIGKAHRMGLSGRPSPIKKTATVAKKEAPKKETAAKKPAAPAVATLKKTAKTPLASVPAKKAATPATGLRPPALTREAPSRPAVQDIPPLNGGVALIDLSERMCKWPYGDPEDDDFTFCGRPIRPGTPYCPDHTAMAYQSSGRSRSNVVYEEKVAEDTVEDDEETPET